MASTKDLRNKALSDMSTSELKSYIDRAEKAGYKISESKDLGKAVDLLKVQEPDKYGSETVASAKTKLLNSTEVSTQQSLGLIPNISSNASRTGESSFAFGEGQPSIDLNQLYEEAINSPELQELESELEAKRRARDEAQADINDNPFYSEATRVGKIAKLDEKAGNDIRTLEASLASRKADAQIKVNIASQQYSLENQAYQQNLQKLNLLMSSGALSGASDSDLAQIAVATGINTSMLKGIQQKMVQEQVKPTVITNTDDAGNVTVSIVDANTGNLIGSNSLGTVGKATKVSGGGSGELKAGEIEQTITSSLAGNAGTDGRVSEETYIGVRNQIVGLGYMTASQFDDLYATSFVNPNYWESYSLTSPSAIKAIRGY